MTDAQTLRCFLLAAVLAASACDYPSIRGCEVIESTSSNTFELDYEALIPSDCPVPLMRVGESKYFGGEIYDRGARNFTASTIAVRNSGGTEVNRAYFLFVELPTGERFTNPIIIYPAGTGAVAVDQGNTTDVGSLDILFADGAPGAYADLRITYIPSGFAADILGPDVPVRSTTQTWSVSLERGTAPFEYKWYRNGELVSTSSSYSANVGTEGFGLRLSVRDATWSTTWEGFWVDVDGIRVSISGPKTVYLSQGGGTWTAVARGGTSGFSYKWYVRDRNGTNNHQVGTGSSWSGYPGEGIHFVTVLARNASGATHQDGKQVYGIGSSDGSCTPEPPAITCNP
jgi:hypothetical protein